MKGSIPFDADGQLIDTENTGGFAWSRADTTGKFGKRTRHEQSIECILPLVFEDQLVPFGNDVGDRTTGIGLAEWNTTIHASSSLLFQFVSRETGCEFFPIVGTFLRIAVLLGLALIFHEPSQFIKLLDCFLFPLLRSDVNNAVF